MERAEASVRLLYAPLYYMMLGAEKLHAVVQLERMPGLGRRRIPGQGWMHRQEVFNLLLDTGATISLLHQELDLGNLRVSSVEDNRLELLSVGGQMEESTAHYQYIEGFHLQGVALPAIPFVRISFDHVTGPLQDQFQCPIHGLLGNDLLLHLQATISYHRNRLTLRLPLGEGGAPHSY